MLLDQHKQHAPKTAVGPVIPAESASSFATTQALWRFLANPQVTPTALVGPLRQLAHQHIDETNAEYILSVIDWSKINYKNHTAKTDVTQLTHKHDIGYELTTHLLVNPILGDPIAAVQMHLKTGDGYLTTAETPPSDMHRLEHIESLADELKAMKFNTKFVTVIDREADSIRHLRVLDQKDHLFLVRSDDRLTLHDGKSLKYSDIVARLEREKSFKLAGEVMIKNKKCVQYVAETTVQIPMSYPAKRKMAAYSPNISTDPLELRLVLTKISDPGTGETVALWYLLSNVPSSVPAYQLALWYYHRWKIESYFKLMKSASQELEHWQQESASAIFKRFLVASMAVATVWQIQASNTEEASEIKTVLTKLSGKARKRGKPTTTGLLLSGFFVFIQFFEFFESINFDVDQLMRYKQMIKQNQLAFFT
jgi:hypothetical protein